MDLKKTTGSPKVFLDFKKKSHIQIKKLEAQVSMFTYIGLLIVFSLTGFNFLMHNLNN
jgi:hypothetical protein